MLVIGYGNPGRGDDGAGCEVAARLEALAPEGVTIDADYQLSIEHAALAAEHDLVVFADAAVDAADDFYFERAHPEHTRTCSTHAVTPGQVLALAQSCFGATPRAYVLGIGVGSLDAFAEGLTPQAEANVAAALAYLLRVILDWRERREGEELLTCERQARPGERCGVPGRTPCRRAST